MKVCECWGTSFLNEDCFFKEFCPRSACKTFKVTKFICNAISAFPSTWRHFSRCLLVNVKEEAFKCDTTKAKFICNVISAFPSTWRHLNSRCLPVNVKGEWASEKFLTEFSETLISFLLWLNISIHAIKSIPLWIHLFTKARAIFE